MAAKRRLIVYEDVDWGFGPTTIPTDSGGTRAATKVPPFSSQGNKSVCTFPGSDAGQKIAAAIADLDSGGGTIDARCFSGTQTISAPIVFDRPVHLILGTGTYLYTNSSGAAFQCYPGSIIEGQGMGATTLHVTVNGANADGINPAANVIIRNLSIQGNTTASSGASAIDGGTSATNVEINGVEVMNFGGHGINSGGGANGFWNIHNCYVHDNHDDGVLLGGVGSHRVINNMFVHNGSNSVDINTVNCLISHNYIDTSGYISLTFDANGILATSAAGSADGNIIESNTVLNSSGHGIIIRADASGHTNNTIIRGNHVSGGVTGINVDVSVGSTCGETSDTIIEGNQSSGNQFGILVGGGAGTPCVAKRTMIRNNVVRTNVQGGIWVIYGSSATVTGNTVLDNTADDLNLSGSTLTLEAGNLTDDSVNQYKIGNGTMVLQTIKADPASTFVAVNSVGNTQLKLTSDEVLQHNNYSFVLDQFKKFNIRNDSLGTIPFNIDTDGNITTAEAVIVGGRIILTGFPLVSLGTPDSGSITYCTDCAADSAPCTGSSTGAIAKAIGGVWDCR